MPLGKRNAVVTLEGADRRHRGLEDAETRGGGRRGEAGTQGSGSHGDAETRRQEDTEMNLSPRLPLSASRVFHTSASSDPLPQHGETHPAQKLLVHPLSASTGLAGHHE